MAQQDVDFSNPIQVFVVFLALMFTGLAYAIRIIPVALSGGILGGLLLSGLGVFAFLKILWE